MDSLQGHCTTEPLAPEDLLDALRSLKGRHAEGVFVPAPGDGVDILMEWALGDIRAAAVDVDPPEGRRHSTNAIMNARRALSCIVDWYLRRDGITFCKDAPQRADAKAEILVRRGIIDELSTRVLARAIDIRNQAEHEYRAVPIEQAEDIVELIRLTIHFMRARSEPDRGPFIFGVIPGGTSSGPNGTLGRFYGWDSAVAVLNTFADEPWIGVIDPSTKTTATARKSPLHAITTDTLLESLEVLEHTFGEISSLSDLASCRVRAAAAGF